MNNSNHVFNFKGGDMLARMAAWWFVSYSYYLHIDPFHENWRNVNTVTTRKSVYNKTKEYHIYWLNEVLNMNQLDKQGNAGNLRGCEIKRMAEELLRVLNKNDRVAELRAMLAKAKEKLEKLKQDERDKND